GPHHAAPVTTATPAGRITSKPIMRDASRPIRFSCHKLTSVVAAVAGLSGALSICRVASPLESSVTRSSPVSSERASTATALVGAAALTMYGTPATSPPVGAHLANG